MAVMRNVLILTGLLLAALGLAACDTTAPTAAQPAVRFTHLPPIQVNVAELVLDEQYKPPLQPPNIEHQLPLSPLTVMRDWSDDRLRAVGSGGSARLVILRASVVREELRKAGGVPGLITKDQAERISLEMKARLEVSTAAGLGTGFAEAELRQSRTLPEGMTLNEREDALFQFVATAARAFDAEMDKNIRLHLGPFLR